MLFYLVRHGQTDWNKEGRLQGREDVPLNARGREEGQELGRALRGLRPEIILSSPLGRAKETARILSGYTGGEVRVEEDLTERDFGAMSGRIPQDIFDPGEEIPMEPLDDVSQRFLRVLERYSGLDKVIAVSHGGAINAVLRTLSGGEIGSGVTRLKNMCVCIVEYKQGRFLVRDYNLTGQEAQKWI